MKKFLVILFLSLLFVGTGTVLVSFAQRGVVGTDAHCHAPELPSNANSEKLAALTDIKGEYFEDQATIDEIWQDSILENNEEGEAESQAEPEVTQK